VALYLEIAEMIRRVAFAACLLLALTGCSEDDQSPRPEPETVFSGTLVFVENEGPLPDLEVTLFEPDAQVVIARDVTDSAGYFEFRGIPEGAYVPVVRSNGFRPILMARPRWPIGEGEQVHVDLRMRRAAAIRDTPYSLTGRVVDRDTGEPIPNARVEMNFVGQGELAQVNWSEYAGWSTTLESAADEDGMFFIEPCPIIDPGTPTEIYVPGYRVTAPGYQSRWMDRNYDPELISSIVQGVRLLKGEDLGTIEGKVLDRNGAPLEGVPVSVEWRRRDGALRGFEPTDDFGRPESIMIPGAVTVSNAEGFYSIGNLPQGFYVVQAGIYPDDGWVGIRVGGVHIEGFSSTATADLAAFRTINVVSPADGATLDAAPMRLEWEPYLDAGRYEVFFRRDLDGDTFLTGVTDPFYEPDPGSAFFNPDCTYGWEVRALDSEGNGIGLTDRPSAFRIDRSAD